MSTPVFRLVVREDGYPNGAPSFIGEDPAHYDCASSEDYPALHATFAPHVVISLKDQLYWLFTNDKSITHHITDQMIRTAVNSCLSCMMDGLDLVDTVSAELDSCIDDYLECAADNGNLPPSDDDNESLITRLNTELFGFVDRIFSVFSESGIACVETVGMPYEYVGRSINGGVLLKRRNLCQVMVMFTYIERVWGDIQGRPCQEAFLKALDDDVPF